jgi:uncharacterized membrane protein (GlpM family)
MVKVIVGAILGALIVLIIAVIALDRDVETEEPKPLTKEQAVKRLQSIKPYYAYGGRTWTAIDMAIRALGGEEEDDDIS